MENNHRLIFQKKEKKEKPSSLKTNGSIETKTGFYSLKLYYMPVGQFNSSFSVRANKKRSKQWVVMFTTEEILLFTYDDDLIQIELDIDFAWKV